MRACVLAAERLRLTQALYQELLEATQQQIALATSEWEQHMLETTERTLRRGLAVLQMRMPEAPSSSDAAEL